ncbi:HAD-IIA family hydrolase [Nitratiruptor sp. YY09-18]|uniref:HAD-IIA family hydrolase n=1 Tax=Nitratiruptor sp. YY09-18 TaxID=2724901 RepID=UPI001916941C|nr:HAD-IIA family hydrolase [Nitratiruptor sp. YY09-18]BCD67542.1 NagD protein [Nitratiruptor sp. YY09-18]
MKFFIDVQGTLIDDTHRLPLPGAIEFVDALNKKAIPYVIITNNTKQLDFLEYLRTLGFEIDDQNYIDPLQILPEAMPYKRVAAYGLDQFLQTLQKLGFILEYKDPEAVLLSVKRDYTFEEFADIDEFLLLGKPLFGMHQTSLYAKGDRRYPGVGALAAMFSFATGVQPQFIGKPSEYFFKKALEKIGAKNFKEITIISDDVQGDLMGAAKLGMRSVFVLSGKYKRAEEILPKLGFTPDLVCRDIAEAGKKLGVL